MGLAVGTPAQHRHFVIAQRLRGVGAAGLAHLFGRALFHHLAAVFAGIGPQVDQPVTGPDHIEVVLDDNQRMAGLQQLAQRAHQLGNVLEMQAGGGLVEQEQAAFARQGLLGFGGALGSLGQETGQLQALGLAARQRGHRLAELHIFQPHIDDGLQRTDHLAVLGEQGRRFADGQLQHIGHIHQAAVALDAHFQNLGAVALAIAIGAAQVDVREELHLHMLKARTATGRAAAIATVEA